MRSAAFHSSFFAGAGVERCRCCLTLSWVGVGWVGDMLGRGYEMGF